MWETLYQDLVTQLGGPVGAFAWASGWLVSYGLYRALRYLYTELSSEKSKAEETQAKMWQMMQDFNETVKQLNGTIHTLQERDTLEDTIRAVLKDSGLS